MPLYPANSAGQPLNVTMKGPDLPKVSSVDEFMQMQTQANARYVSFQDDDDVFYIMETNENNYKAVSRYRFYEDPIPKPEDNYATKQEIMDLKGDIANVQQLIQQLIESSNSKPQYNPKPKHNGANGSNKRDVSSTTEVG